MTLFQPGEIVADGPVRLQAAALEDLAALPWLTAALAPDWTVNDLTRAVEAGRGVAVRDAEGVLIGLMVALLDRPHPSEASVPFIAIDPARRYRGLGGSAGLALERLLRVRFGVEAVYASIPDGRGLAVYFWLRLGYRPLTRSEAPWPLEGLSEQPRPGIWMAREGA